MDAADLPVVPEIEEKLNALPAGPGVYLLRDGRGKVIYVGKAKSLRSRVRSYFRGGDERAQVRFLVRRIADFEVIVTSNEKEALVLENNLIKQYRPRYNIRLKDDKSYVSVKVTVHQPWPRILVTRRIVRDGSRYFGPFTSAWSVRQTLDVIRKVIPLRTCSDGVFRNRSRPCLEYQIRRCPAPCCLPVDREAYQRNLRQAMLLLEGRDREVVRMLREDMNRAAAELRFEEAARLRDRIRAIERTQERQQAGTHWGPDQDVFGLCRQGGVIDLQVLFVRGGKITGHQGYQVRDHGLPDEDVVADVLTQFYQGERPVPEEILLPVELEDREVRQEMLAERRGRRVAIVRPRRGPRLRLLELACENAKQSARERAESEGAYERAAQSLQRRLRLRGVPRRIECVDISAFQGGDAVGSVVAFQDGEPDRSGYRRYRIRTVAAADDFAMMREVLRRRFRAERAGEGWPDLLVVDGGKGQLGVALAVLGDLGIDRVEVVGLAKARSRWRAGRAGGEQAQERVFLPGRRNPVLLPRGAPDRNLLERIRDEAHRFAITYHRARRRRERLRSRLDAVPGIGPARRGALLRHFGSADRIAAASVEEVMRAARISETLARRVLRELRAGAAPRRLVLVAEGRQEEGESSTGVDLVPGAD